MEKLKDPAMLLSVANSIGIVGTTAYFYKQLEAQRLDLIKLSQTLTAVTRKVAEMEKGEQNKGEALHSLNNQIKEVNQQLENMPTFEHIENLDQDLTEITSVLEDNDIPIDRPSQVVRPRRRGGDRGPTSRRQDDDDRQSTSARRATGRSSDRSSARDEGRISGRDDIRGPPRREPRPRQETNYDDDIDLISQVRQQQTR